MIPHAVVFGGSRGIGRACAEKFLNKGWKCVIVSKNKDNLGKAVTDINNSNLSSMVCDLSNESSINKVVSDIEKNHGPIEVLVNSAGITSNKLLLQTTLDDIKTVFDTNLVGTILTTKAVVKGMLRRKSGSIVNIGSIVGSRGNTGQCIYSASKSGLVGFTKSLAKEVASRNIRVNLVSPGFVETDMTQDSTHDIVSTIPLKRMGSPQEIADLVFFLSCHATYVTGQDIICDGGLSMKM